MGVSPRGTCSLLLVSNIVCYWRVGDLPLTGTEHGSASAMSHYTANLRDLEFNLFEFLDTKDRFGTGPFEQMDAETARGVLGRDPQARRGPDRRVLHRRRPQPAGLRPRHALGDAARVVQEVDQGHRGRRVVPARPARGARRLRRPARADLGRLRDGAGREPRRLHVRVVGRLRRRAARARHAGPAAHGRAHARAPLGRHDGAHRARRRLRRRAPAPPRPCSRPTARGTSPA